MQLPAGLAAHSFVVHELFTNVSQESAIPDHSLLLKLRGKLSDKSIRSSLARLHNDLLRLHLLQRVEVVHKPIGKQLAEVVATAVDEQMTFTAHCCGELISPGGNHGWVAKQHPDRLVPLHSCVQLVVQSGDDARAQASINSVRSVHRPLTGDVVFDELRLKHPNWFVARA